jgi:hypothetical protein
LLNKVYEWIFASKKESNMTVRECIGCRVIKEVDSDDICIECREWEKKHLEELRLQVESFFKCSKCNYEGVATDLHHIVIVMLKFIGAV